MSKQRLIALVLLALIVGSGCSKKDHSDVTTVEESEVVPLV